MNGQQRPAQPTGSMMGIIRPEQVAKLPQLNPAQKQQFHGHVQKLWQIITDTAPNDPKHAEAQQALMNISQQLMQGMKQFRAAAAARAAQIQQAQAAAAGQGQQSQGQGQQQQQQQQPAQAGATAPSQSTGIPFNQLLPEIRAKVNEQHFFFPPAIVEGTKAAEDWLREAKARFGQALQRAQLAKTKKMEFQRAYQQRESQGNPLNPQERETYSNKLTQCNKAIQESQSFMEKFKEQQATFKRQQAERQPSERGYSNAGISSRQAEPAAPEPPPATPTVVAVAQPGVPNAHSITSAVTAARNAAALAAQHGGAAGSPAHGQVTGPAQTPTNAPNPLNSSQSPTHPSTALDHSRPSSAHPGQSANHQQSSTPHAHPLNSLSVKPQGPSITKNLVVSELKPVQMPPSRPTLNGGAGVGLPGQIAQPALTALPGFVLESSEDGRVLSKKKLNELVREVFGPSSEDQLTPEAEEIFLQVADDFVDDLIQASCKLVKLRGSNTLEPRDIMVVLERQYNIRIPGFSTDEVRAVRRSQPATGWAHKMSAVQAAKLTGGGSTGQALGSSALQGKD